MKTSLYIEEGVTQIVLTPETSFEKDILARSLGSKATLLRGSFYHCAGGWNRQGNDDDSLMIRLEGEKAQGSS